MEALEGRFVRDINKPWYLTANYYWVKQENLIKDLALETMKPLQGI